MNQNKPAVVKKLQERFRNVSVGRGLYMAFVMPTMLSMFSTRAFAADTIWTKASAIMQDVYTQILSISTIAAVVTAAVALLLMNFSRSGRTVDESRAWLKRIIITWAMLASHMTSPTVTYDISVDMANMQDYRAQLMAGGLKVSYTDLLVKFVAKALTEFPLLNCSIEGDEIIFKHYINMGVAVALDDGLVVPNITNTDQKSLAEISAELKELSTAARNGTLGMDRMREGTFTITNLGMFGIESFSPIINQPEVAILGVNTMKDEFVIRDGEQSIRPIMKLSLTADHRVVDGAVAARFLQRVKQLLELPALMLV